MKRPRRDATTPPSFGRAAGGYMQAAVAGSIAGGIGNILLARWLGADQYGVYVAVLLVTSWGLQAHFGLFNSLLRDYPLVDASAGPEDASRVADTGFAASTLIFAVVSATIIGVTAWASPEPDYLLGIVVFAALLPLENYLKFSMAYQRISGNFTLANLTMGIRRVSDSVFKIGLVLVFGFAGAIAGSAFSAVAAVIFLAVSQRARFRFRLDWSLAWRMLRTGFPMFLSGTTSVLILGIGRALAVRGYDDAVVAWYGLGFLLATQIQLVTSAFTFVHYPLLLRESVRMGLSADWFRSMVVSPSLAVAVVTAAGSAVTMVGLDVLIRVVLPEFVPGIFTAQLLSGFLFLLGASKLFELACYAGDHRTPPFLAQAAALGLIIALSLAALGRGYEPWSIAMAQMIGAGAYLVWVVHFSHLKFDHKGRWAWRALVVEIELGLLLGAGLIAVLLTSGWQPVAGSALEQFLYGLARTGLALIAVAAVAGLVEALHHPMRRTLRLIREAAVVDSSVAFDSEAPLDESTPG